MSYICPCPAFDHFLSSKSNFCPHAVQFMTLMTFLILFLSAIGPNFFPKTMTELQDKTWTNIGFDFSGINNLATLYLDIKWTNAGHIEIQFLSIYCPSNKFISKFLYITVLQGLDKYWTNSRCINLKYIQALSRLCPGGDGWAVGGRWAVGGWWAMGRDPCFSFEIL